MAKPFPYLQVQRLMDVPNDNFEYFVGVIRGPGLAIVGELRADIGNGPTILR